MLKQAIHGMSKENSVKNHAGDEISFNKALSCLLDQSISQCDDDESQMTHSQSDNNYSQVDVDGEISVELGTLNPAPTKQILGDKNERQTDANHGHSKSSATIY